MWCPCERSRSEVKVKVKSIPRIMHLGNLVIAIHGILFIMCLIICNTNYIDISCCTFLITFEVLIGEANVQLDINHLAKFVFHLEKLQSKYIKLHKKGHIHIQEALVYICWNRKATRLMTLSFCHYLPCIMYCTWCHHGMIPLIMSEQSFMLWQHWFRWWLGAWRHQTITWTIVDQRLCHHDEFSTWTMR